MKQMYDKKFGVEVEFTGIAPRKLWFILAAKSHIMQPNLQEEATGSQLYFVAHPELFFKFKTDASVTRPGGELNTPILCEAQLPLLKQLLGFMIKSGAHTDKSCGLHVHVALPFWIDRMFEPGTPEECRQAGTLEQYQRDRCIFAMFLFRNWKSILGRARRSLQVSQHRDRNYCSMDFTKQVFLSTRKLAINVTQANHPTTEYRLFDGHMNFRYIVRAIRFACAFSTLAENLINLEDFPCPHGCSLDSHFDSLIRNHPLDSADCFFEKNGARRQELAEKAKAFFLNRPQSAQSNLQSVRVDLPGMHSWSWEPDSEYVLNETAERIALGAAVGDMIVARGRGRNTAQSSISNRVFLRPDPAVNVTDVSGTGTVQITSINP